MSLFNLVFRHSYKSFILFVVLGTIVGILQTMLILMVDKFIINTLEGKSAVGTSFFAYFAVILLAYILTSRIHTIKVIWYSQRTIGKLRLNLVERFRTAAYAEVIAKRDEIYAVLTKDIVLVTAALLQLVSVSVYSVTIVLCVAYIFVLNTVFALFSTLAIGLGIALFKFNNKRNVQLFEIARDTESKFISSVESLIAGFKEIKLKPKIGREIAKDEIEPILRKSEVSFAKGAIGFLNNSLIGTFMLYAFIGAMLYVVAAQWITNPSEVINGILILLFLMVPIQSIMAILPEIEAANVAARRILSIQHEMPHEQDQPQEAFGLEAFSELHLKQITFTHHNSEGEPFLVGPLDFTVRKGNVTFIHGGNGSGKTTLLKVISGYYKPESGKVLMNRSEIGLDGIKKYSSYFSAVFHDFYLFKKLYGLAMIDQDLLKFYFDLFEIDHKVRVENKYFSTTNLSAGQRKRLALIVMLLDKRPILLLDEWASEQDPVFKKKFYAVILPILKQRGFTIIAITHDDLYYSYSDKIYRMDYGSLFEDKAYADSFCEQSGGTSTE